jgi:hypothetical protein
MVQINRHIVTFSSKKTRQKIESSRDVEEIIEASGLASICRMDITTVLRVATE